MVSDAPCSASPRLCEMNMNLVTAASHHSAAPTPPTLHCKESPRYVAKSRIVSYKFITFPVLPLLPLKVVLAKKLRPCSALEFWELQNAETPQSFVGFRNLKRYGLAEKLRNFWGSCAKVLLGGSK